MKQNNIFGSPIMKEGNAACPYYKIGNSSGKDMKFGICTCPFRNIYKMENKCGTIIECDENYKTCEIYSEQSIRVKDIKIVEQYIVKYGKSSETFEISSVHWDAVRDKFLTKHDDVYLMDLFKYFGYYKLADENKKRFTFTNQKYKHGE
jgi:hypothetical protein